MSGDKNIHWERQKATQKGGGDKTPGNMKIAEKYARQLNYYSMRRNAILLDKEIEQKRGMAR